MQDFYGRTALHAAIASNSLQCVEAILSKDQEVANIYSDGNQSVLHTAVKFGQPAIIKTLISSAPQLSVHMNTDGKSAVDIAEL
jgi:ankyrin repeat protein